MRIEFFRVEKAKRLLMQFFFAGVFLFLSLIVHSANAPITTVASIPTAIPGQQVTVPVTVTGFSNIGSFYLSLDYDYSKLHFVSGTNNPLLAGFLNIGDNNLGNGFHRLIISWVGGSGLAMPNGTWIAKYVFTYISGPAQLQWYDMGPSCEYTDPGAVVLNDSPTPTYYINGTVSQQPIRVNARVFLEGPYSNMTMSTSLNSQGAIPLVQPYSLSPWNYNGVEQVDNMPANTTDWVLVELRTAVGAASKVATHAAFLKNDGYITDLDGASLLDFAGLAAGNYYIVIRHRNHMPVMSATAVSLSASSGVYDFSIGSGQVYGGANGYKNIDPALSIWGMVSGDATNDGSVYIDDYTDFWVQTFGTASGYNRADFKMDGNVFINDYTDFWVLNFGKSNALP